jgi:hypothetical protein
MRIAICTAAFDRARELRETLLPNLEAIEDTPHFIALCDLGSNDGLDHYVRKEFPSHVTAGKLVFFRARERPGFHAAMAKNAAHRLGLCLGATVLFNVDPEHFVTSVSLGRVAETFSRKGAVVVHDCAVEHYAVHAGRIAVTAEDWQLLGGYDEALPPLAREQFDFLFRCRASGREYVQLGKDLPRPVDVDYAALLSTTKWKLANSECPSKLLTQFSTESLAIMFRRPVKLSPSDQCRFEGTINFREDIVL